MGYELGFLLPEAHKFRVIVHCIECVVVNAVKLGGYQARLCVQNQGH